MAHNTQALDAFHIVGTPLNICNQRGILCSWSSFGQSEKLAVSFVNCFLYARQAMTSTNTIWVSIEGAGKIEAKPGATLRQALLDSDRTPYLGKFQKLNCRGLGVCGSCLVDLREGDEFWERRSCQVRVYRDLEVRLKKG